MKVLLYSKFGKYPKEIENLIKSFGLEIVKNDPEVVVTYGGDGTLLGAERDFPDIPKLPLRNSAVCHLCSRLSNEEVLKLLVQNKLHKKEIIKLEAVVDNKTLTGINDIILAHKFPNTAIRFNISSLSPVPELIGDGLVVSTPLGSTGYFYSITKKPFTQGIGLAFNNIHNVNAQEQILDESAEIKIKILRGPAVLAADNNPNLIDLSENDEFTIKKAVETATILVPHTLLVEG